MSSSNLTKKLLPLRKALKNIKNNHQLKSYSSKIVKIIKTTRKHCITVYQSFSRLIYSKFRTLTNRPLLHHHPHPHHLHQNFSIVYIDELFQGKTLSAEQIQTKENMAPSSSISTIEKQSPQVIKTTHDVRNLQNYHVNIESSANHEKGLPLGKGKAKSDENLSNSAATDKWKIPALPQFRGIDDRAEEFITKFRQDMKLQREQSILDFEEMLKRSV